MSFGALGARAVRAMNAGAQKGGFAHNTGEGGLSAYHRAEGGANCDQSLSIDSLHRVARSVKKGWRGRVNRDGFRDRLWSRRRESPNCR